MLLSFLGIKKVVVLLFQKVIHTCELLGNVPYKLDTDYNRIIKRNNGSHVHMRDSLDGTLLATQRSLESI